jgi:ribosomal protein S18 acetylase RimI-like enzyme
MEIDGHNGTTEPDGRKIKTGMDYIVRRARLSDLEKLVDFTLAEAVEAEGSRKSREKARRGILAALEDESIAVYWVLEDSRSYIVGNISVVKEWSNWHAGHYWWIQSLYIRPEHRGRGLIETLIRTVKESAKEGGALDLRLYVHKHNRRAIRAYQKCGFRDADYQIMRMDI